ncbi:hypothetical protein B4146_2753 [Bacillus subtilis]|nr:hypothetical protein B4146_2753 [Bacillus subtilis]
MPMTCLAMKSASILEKDSVVLLLYFGIMKWHLKILKEL